MLEEHHGIVRSDRRAQQPRGVERRRGDHHPNAGRVREEHLSGLAVVDRATGQVAAARDAHDERALEAVRGAPAQVRHLVPELVHRRPDVVEELDLDHRLETSSRQAHRAADDVGFGEGRVVDARRAERALQAVGHLEDAALALDLVERTLARAVGDVLAEDDDRRVAAHLFMKGAVDVVEHRLLARLLEARVGLGVERLRGRVDVGRVDPQRRAPGLGLRRGERAVRGVVDLGVDLLLELLELLGRQHVVRHERVGEREQRVAPQLVGDLRFGPVELLVVGERVRVRPDDPGVDERDAPTSAAVLDGLAHRGVARDRVAAVDLPDREVREARDELRDRAAGRLHLDGDRDRVAVVLDDEHDRQRQVAGRVHRLPELALRGRAVSGRHVDDLVVFEAVRARLELVDEGVAVSGLGAADRLEELRAGRRRRRDDVEPRVAPVRRHLPAARARVVGRADRLEQHVVGRHAELEAERPVAIVRVEPVVGRAQGETGCRQDCFVARAADLEEDLILALELDLFVVDTARRIHGAVDRDELFRA